MVGAVIGGLGSLAGGIFGAMESADANEKNWQIALLNYYQRERERRERIQQEQRNRSDARLGATDAEGNRTRFIEGQGWVTELSRESQELDNLQDREQLRTLANDLPLRRERMEDNIARQREEDFMAQAFMDELRGVRKEDPGEIEALLREASTRGVNEAHDEASAPLLRTAIRTGASNIDKIAQGVAASRSKALSDAFIDARLKSMDVVENRYNQRRSNASNLFNLFAERAGRMPEVSYAPQNVSAQSANNLSQFASQGANAASALAQAFGAQGGTLDYVQPDYGLSNALVTAGQTIGGIGDKFQAQGRYEDQMDMLYKRYGLGTRTRGSTGIF